MANDVKEIEQTIQNLKDAGCSKSIVKQFLCLFEESKEPELHQLLNRHRKSLLKMLHIYQKKLDCLDFLIFQMKKDSKRHKD